MEILVKDIGPEAKAKVEIVEGKLILTAQLDTQGMGANAQVSVDVDYFLDELAAKIPGTVDDMVISMLKSALKAL